MVLLGNTSYYTIQEVVQKFSPPPDHRQYKKTMGETHENTPEFRTLDEGSGQAPAGETL